LLGSLAVLELTSAKGERIEMRVVVLDNDEGGSAREIAERHADRIPNIAYEIEPIRGISRARNRLVELALEPEDPPNFVAFLDDDEWVDPSWLWSFITCASEMPCVLVGPVLPWYEEGIPEWIRDGHFFERTQNAAGRNVHFAGAGNLLIPRMVLSSLGEEHPFGEIFERPGGEDAFFSVLVQRRGYEIQWCDAAVAHEEVSGQRASTRWLVRRAFNGGYDFSRVVRLTRSSRGELVHRVASGLGHFGLGVALLFPALVQGRAAVLRAARKCAAGAGTLAGLLDAMPASAEFTERVGTK
jgi:glycosyltransferase involved in cell wall biosynthesis